MFPFAFSSSLRGVVGRLLLAALLLSGVPSAVEAQGTVRMIAPPGTSERNLGQLYDGLVQPMRQTLPTDGAPENVAESRTYRDVQSLATATEVHANARVWGVGVQAGASSEHSVGYIRAIALEHIIQIPHTHAVPERSALPEGAAYFVSRIYYGRMFELRVEGNSRQVQASVQTLAMGAGGSRREESIRTEGVTMGLQPRGDALTAMAAASQTEILQNFQVSGEAVPILVELEALGAPPSSAPAVAGGGSGQLMFQVQVASLTFPARKPSGAPWDAFGNPPDMQVTFVQNGRVVARLTAPRDTVSYNFGTSLPQLISVSPTEPLIISFFDLDAMAHDSAGQATIDDLHSGEIEVASTMGARLVLRAVPR
ncbi:MAG: hypothetical protein VYE22_13880 [Myxococcota bacterium]|nr:hypothetical protein [Myxococcota bacterium]